MSLINKYKQYRFKKFLKDKNNDQEIFWKKFPKLYTEMPCSLVSYNDELIYQFDKLLEFGLPIDKIISHKALLAHIVSFHSLTPSMVKILNFYKEHFSQQYLIIKYLKCLRPYDPQILHQFFDHFDPDLIYQIIKDTGPVQNNIFLIKQCAFTSDITATNLFDALGFYYTRNVDINNDEIQMVHELLNSGIFFTFHDLYDRYKDILSPALKTRYESAFLLNLAGDDLIAFLESDAHVEMPDISIA